MHYFGGKFRLRKQITEVLKQYLKPDQVFYDVFCGACNVVSEMPDTNKRIANDKHKELIEMWKVVKDGDLDFFPDTVSEEVYRYAMKHIGEYNPALLAFVGFGCSFAGRYFEGYARDPKSDRNYAKETKNSLIKIYPKVKGIEFLNLDYKEIDFESNSLIYCDPPYANTKRYSTGQFDSKEFLNWTIQKAEQGHTIIIS